MKAGYSTCTYDPYVVVLRAYTTELVEENFVCISWDTISDLSQISGTRDGLIAELARITPEERHKAIPHLGRDAPAFP
ncbi:hypothetical protein [Glutamicibacter sp. NPDC087583]|uniref:hypothetical protein n=1 Tax=Glutamicibacter sp. NPDC087583 TaxID=3363995 RepID=UPI003818A30C